MKWLFLVLLLVNVALLFYVFRDSSVPAVPESALLTEARPPTMAPPLPPEESAEVQQLLAKAQAVTKEASADVKIIESELDTSPNVTALCLKVGPFVQADDAESVMSKLSAAGLKGARQSTEEKNDINYWVYLPPFATKDGAIAASRKLAENGEEDNFVISTGTNKNAISLGLYTDKQKAQTRYEQLVQKGYDPVLDVRPQHKTNYWLILRSDTLPENKAMQLVRDSVRNMIEIQIQRRGC